MLKNISLVLSALIFVGCSTTNENLQKPQANEQDIAASNEEVDYEAGKKAIKEIINDINSVPMTSIDSKTVLNETTIENQSKEVLDAQAKEPIAEKKMIVKFSFNGEWIGNKTSKFLQRKIELNQLNESFARGNLILSYLNTSGKETITDRFNLEVFLNDFEIEGFIKDAKTSKIEKIRIFRDSENEFRIIADDNTIFFENSSMMFKKKVKVVKEKEDIQISVIKEYFKNENNQVIDSKNSLVWQDSNSAKFLKTNYENANSYCQNLGDTWRLPSRNEINGTYSIVDNKINEEFKNSANASYWTNEESIDDVLKAWSFDYSSGKEAIVSKDNKLNIRCVKANEEIKN